MKHDTKAVDQLLGGYTGTVVADAHNVYDHIFKDGRAIEAGCPSRKIHPRRFQAAKRRS